MDEKDEYRADRAPDDFQASELSNLASGSKLSKRVWHMWFRFLLQQYKADEQIDIRTVKALFSVYFLIIGIGLTDWQGFDQKIVGQSLFSYSQRTAIRILLLVCVLLSWTLIVVCFLICGGEKQAPNSLEKLVCLLKHINWSWIFPISISLYSKDLFYNFVDPETGTLSSSNDCAVSWILILSCYGLCLLRVALRSELPTSSKYNSPNRLVELAHYTVLMLLLTMGHNLRDTAGAQAFQIASKIVGFGMIVAAWRLQVFWWYEVNLWYIVGHLVIFCLRLTVLVVLVAYTKPGIICLGICICVFVIMLARIASNLCIYRVRLGIQWSGNFKNLENFTTFFTCELAHQSLKERGYSFLPQAILFELAQVGRMRKGHENETRINRYSDLNEIGTARHELTPRFEGLFSTSRGKPEKPIAVANIEPEPELNENSNAGYDYLWEYFQQYKSLKIMKTDELWILMLLQLIFLRKNLLEISLTLARYRKSLGSWAETSLNLFLIETMLRSRLETISMDDSSSNDRGRTTLAEIFATISTDVTSVQQDLAANNARPVFAKGGWTRVQRSSKKELSSSLEIDLGRILACKHEYLTIISGINWFLDVKSDIFSMLFETYAHKSWFLYKRNALARKLTTKIDKAILKLMSWPRVPNYVYSAGMAYYLKVKFDLQKSEKIFKIYKANIFKYQTISNIHTKEINETNFMYNSVIMKLSISQDSSLGAITDITPNYKEHLGDPPSQDPIKQNINSLFPGKMMELHTKMMQGTADQQMFNTQHDFQLNGFDGHLRALRYLLKLDTSVAEGLHVIALLKFQTSKHKHLLLVDDKMDIVSAETGFWTVADALRVTSSVTSLWGLSESLAAQIFLMKYLKMVSAEVTEETTNPTTVTGEAQMAKQISVSSAQNIEIAKQIQASGLQKFGEQAYKLMKQQVGDALLSYESLGILHVVNEELGAPGLPIHTKVEFTSFGQENYYRVWLSFDLGFNRETRSIRTTQKLMQDELKSKLPSSFVDLTGEKQAIKMSESESHNDVKGHFNDSLKSDLFQGEGSVHNDFRGTKLSFEQVLQRMRTETPIMALMTEALNKEYPDEIKNALSWVKQYLKNIEVPELSFKADHKLSTVIRHMTQHRFVSDVSRNVTGQFERGNTASDLNNPYNESPIMYLKKDSTTPKLIKGLSRGASGVKDEGGNLGISTNINSHQLNPHSSPLPSNSDIEPQGSSRSDIAKPVQVTIAPIHKKTVSLSRPLVQKKDSSKGTTTPKVPKVNIKHRNAQTLGNQGEKSFRISMTKLSGDPPQTKRTDTTKESNLMKMRKAELTSNQTIRSSQDEHKTIKPEFNLVDAADEKLEVSGSDHHTAKTSIFSQLAKKLFRFRSVRQATHDNSKAHSEKKRNELNPLAISAMAKAEAFISQNEANAKIISRYIGDFKALRRADMNPDDKNNSVTGSQSSNASRGSYFLKIVTNTIDTPKKGIMVYFFTLGMAVFSIYYLAIFQYLIGTMRSYNLSTLNNFNLVDNFITLDRKITQTCEVQDYISGLSSGLFKKEDYMYGIASFARLVPRTVNGSTFLMGQLSDLTNDLYLSMTGILRSSLDLDTEDLKNVNAATFNDEKLSHWGNLTTPGIYEEWTLPYFTVLMYYNNLYRKNLAVLRELSNLAWNTNYNFTMSPSLASRYEQMITTKIAMDSRIYNQVMVAKDKQFDGIIDNVVNLSVARYFNSIFTILYVSLAVMVLMVCYVVYTMYQINIIQRDYLENYNLLRPWELFVIIEEIEKLVVLFTKFAFNEIQMMGQYLDFNLYSRSGNLGNRLGRLEHHFSREKDKVSSGYKYDHDFKFMSSKFAWVLVFLTGLLFGLIYLTVAVFQNTDQRRQGIVKLYFDSHRGLLQVTKYYLMSPLIAIYGYAIPVSGESISKNAYTTAIDDFTVFHTLAKANYSYLLGDQGSVIEKVNFGTICDYLVTEPSLKARFGGLFPMCNMNDASASKGLVGFLQYEKFFVQNVITRFQTNYSDWLEKSRTVTPRVPIFRELFEPRFLELRVGHRLMFNIYYFLMSKIVVNLVTTIKTQLDYFVDVVMQSIVSVVYVLMLGAFLWMARLQHKELEVCYETFRLIDPYFLVNNRYLQFRFKAAFKGVE